jgi:hypothetical protein
MPPLNKMSNLNLSNYAPASISDQARVGFARPPVPAVQQPNFKSNPYIRTPLPPFNSSVDVLRQFPETGQIPTMRAIPLPVIASGGTGSQTSHVDLLASAASSSSSSGSSLTPQNVVITYPFLATGQAFQGTVAMAISFQLLGLAGSNSGELRLYSNSAYQTLDLGRPTDDSPSYEVSPGLISDVVFDTPPYQWVYNNQVGANADTTPDSTIYFTVINPSQVALSGGSFTVTFLPLAQ